MIRTGVARSTRVGVKLVVLAAAAVTLLAAAFTTPAAADEPPGWRDGANTHSQVINCPSQILGNPYWEPGIAAKVGYYGDPDSGVPHVAEHYTYLHLVFAGLGNPCAGGTYLFPNVALPTGVEWYKDADILCYWNGGPLTGDNCPQWNAVLEGQGPSGSDAYVHPGNTSWHVSQGGILELVLPIWAPRQAVHGDTVQTWVHTADGNLSPTLTPSVPVWFFTPPGRTATCQGQPVTVDMRKGQLPTAGSDVIRGTRGADVIRAGAGDDVVCARKGPDTVRGGKGRDTLDGGAGRDLLAGGAGHDSCSGGPGVDTSRGCEARTGVPRGTRSDPGASAQHGTHHTTPFMSRHQLITGEERSR